MNQLLSTKVVTQNRKKRAVRRRRQEIITSVKITRALYRDIQTLAKKMDRTQSWIMREAVQSWVTYHSKQTITAAEYVAAKQEVEGL